MPAPPSRLAESIVPPDTLSPLIWLSASVSVPPEMSIVPPVMLTLLAFCVAIVPKPRFVRAVVLPEVVDASVPKPPFASGRIPETAFVLARLTVP